MDLVALFWSCLNSPVFAPFNVPERSYGAKGRLVAHVGLDPSDVKGTVPVAQGCAAQGHTVVLLKASNEQRVKSADALVDADGYYWEFKHVTGSMRSIKGAVAESNRKAEVLWIEVRQPIALADIIRAVKGQLMHYKRHEAESEVRLKAVWVYIPGNEAISIDTNDLLA